MLATYGGVSLIKILQEKNKKEEKEGANIDDAPNFLKLATKGFLLNIINVVVLFYWVGIILYFGPQFDMEKYKITLFFVVIVATYFCVDLGKI